MKFEISVIIYLLTITLLLYGLGKDGAWRRTRLLLGWGFMLCMTVENGNHRGAIPARRSFAHELCHRARCSPIRRHGSLHRAQHSFGRDLIGLLVLCQNAHRDSSGLGGYVLA